MFWFYLIIIVFALALFGSIYEGFKRPFEIDDIKRTRESVERTESNSRLEVLNRQKEILELRKEIEELKNK